MKFSFESKEYRKNLADQLREKKATDKNEAKEFLKNRQATPQYRLSKDITRVTAKITKNEGAAVNVDAPEVSVEIRKVKNESGVERTLEIKTFDISNRIPEDLKLYFDQFRLVMLDSEHPNYGSGKYPDKKFHLGESGYAMDFNRFTTYKGSISTEARIQLGKEQARGKAPRSRKDVEEAEEKHRQNVQESKKVKDFINEITEGAFYDPKIFCHIAGAEYEEQKALVQRYPLSDKNSEVPREEIFDATQTSARSLWFNAGKAEWFDPMKIIMFCSSESNRFKEEIEDISFYDRGNESHRVYIEAQRTGASQIEAAAKAANLGGGVNFHFKKEEVWADIADWIVDLYHGRLYKITEK